MNSFTDFTPGKTVIIFQRNQHAAVYAVAPDATPTFVSQALQALGYTLSIMSLAALFLMIYPMLSLEVSYRLKSNNQPITTNQSHNIPMPAVAIAKEPVIVPEDSNFGVVIPKINVNTNVVSDVDPANEDEYLQALQQGLAHAKGTTKPGQRGTSFIFGHSTDTNPINIANLNAQFYLLKELVPGDMIYVFYQGKKHVYQVRTKQIVAPTDVALLQPQTRTEKLVLQTCWPPATTLKRLIIEATPVLL